MVNPFANWKLVDDVRNAWRWASMRIFALIAVISTVWVSIPSDVKALVPASWNRWIFIAIAVSAVAGGLGRITKQNIPEVPPK
jgi:hypothetical protein